MRDGEGSMNAERWEIEEKWGGKRGRCAEVERERGRGETSEERCEIDGR